MQKNGLSRKEVAARYNVHVNTVDKWVKKGLLKPIRFVGRVYFTESELSNFEKRAAQ